MIKRGILVILFKLKKSDIEKLKLLRKLSLKVRKKKTIIAKTKSEIMIIIRIMAIKRIWKCEKQNRK